MKFQSTHPHGVRRAAVARIYRPGCVSIHAPSRGATWEDVRNTILVIKFQSTHPHGVRPTPELMPIARTAFQSTHPHGVRLWPSFGRCCECRCFNPRTLTGCDSSYTVQQQGSHGVSIHAPSRGATDKTNPNQKHLTVSIHAPSRGATLPSKQAIMLYGMFQSTHPHGVRRGCWSKKPIGSMFQSTHPHGVRL